MRHTLYKRSNSKGRTLTVTFLFACLIAIGLSCNKLVQIPPPVSTITTSQVFSDSASASAAIAGLYNYMIATGQSVAFGSGLITLYGGLSSDELDDYFQSYPPVYYNNLTISGSWTDGLWDNAYSLLYPINASIESIQSSSGIENAAKSQFIGEAKFMRAFCYFYLVNLYGDVPLLLTSNYQTNSIAARTPKADVYKQIIQDLKDAQSSLRSDYSISNGNRTRANQAAATALLARTYLYTGDWADAYTQATAVINNSSYSLVSNLNNIFLANSNEAILQWQLNTAQAPFNATPEGYNFIPASGYAPYFTISSFLDSAFEPGDQRPVAWIDSSNYSGTEIYYPYKYKVGGSAIVPNATATESYMVLRLAEMYLIRAEAQANQAGGGAAGAIVDLNAIRSRAGLTPLPGTLSGSQLMAAVMQERRVELFAEWGARWFDLKRTGAIDSVMNIVTPLKGGGNTWKSYQQLYPIPRSEMVDDPNMVQNPQY